MFNNKNILITGGTGSFGKKFVQIVINKYKPNKLIVFSRDELKQFEMEQKFPISKYPFLEYVIGDVRDKDRLINTFRKVDYVIHAAALKQVPAAEKNPEEFIKTNINGAMNIIEAAKRCGIKKLIALSTDKACNPVNLYGATKLASDKLFIAANDYFDNDAPKFSVVRYGNVLGSRGSVIPFFKEKVKTGVLPITDERMTRFWITLDQAVHFVLHTISISLGGELFVPKIPSMKILDLANAISVECEKDIVGIRPGEKLHEIMISEDDGHNTVELENYYIIHPDSSTRERLLSENLNSTSCKLGFKYSSDNNTEWMTVENLRTIIERITDDYSIEESRWG